MMMMLMIVKPMCKVCQSWVAQIAFLWGMRIFLVSHVSPPGVTVSASGSFQLDSRSMSFLYDSSDSD